jgi:hypothetical protein
VLLPSIVPTTQQPLAATIGTLRDVALKCNNLGTGKAEAVLFEYQRWAVEAAGTLGFLFDAEDVDRLVHSQRHWLIASWFGAPNPATIFGNVNAEKRVRLRALDQVRTELEAVDTAWRDVDSVALAPDTNVYLHDDSYVDDIDWCQEANAVHVTLLIPIAVVRELDEKKRAAKNIPVSDTNAELLRKRAHTTVGKLRKMLWDVWATGSNVQQRDRRACPGPFGSHAHQSDRRRNCREDAGRHAVTEPQDHRRDAGCRHAICRRYGGT